MLPYAIAQAAVDLASPGPIGGTTPSTGNFTALTATSLVLGGATLGPYRMAISGMAIAEGLTTTSPGWYAQLIGDAVPRVRIGLNATDVASIAFGAGAGARDLFIERAAAAAARLGGASSATPVAQTITVQGSRAGTDTNIGGGNLTVQSGLGTGTGAASSLIFQTPTVAASGSGTQTYTTRLTLDANGVTVPNASAIRSANGLASITLGSGGTGSVMNFVGAAQFNSAGGQFLNTNRFDFNSAIGFGSNVQSAVDLFLSRGSSTTLSLGSTFSGVDGTFRLANLDSGAASNLAIKYNGTTEFSATTAGLTVASGKALTLGNAATTGLVAGALAALTNATLVLLDSTGQAYRVPCII